MFNKREIRKINNVQDIVILEDILKFFNRNDRVNKTSSGTVVRKYVDFALAMGGTSTYSNYNTALRAVLIELNSTIKDDNCGMITKFELNLLKSIERALRKPYGLVNEGELSYD